MEPPPAQPVSSVLLDQAGRIVDPVFVVDLDDPAVTEPVTGDRVLLGVAVGPLDERRRAVAATLDVTLVRPGTATGAQFVEVVEPEAEARRLRAAAETNPRAALVLAAVLRAAPADARAGLDLESFAYSTLLGGPEFTAWLARRGPRPPPPPVTGAPVLLRRDDEVLHVTLNRPERRNAYGREVRDGLVEALRLAELDPSIRRVVLDGAGPSFCSGGDLDEFGTAPDLATAHFVRTRAGAAAPLHRLADRVEARVHGSCVGAGIELPAFAGRLVATDGTTFRLPEVGMGLIPGAGGTVSIPRRIGRWRTLYLALSGRALPVGPAADWGLVDAVA